MNRVLVTGGGGFIGSHTVDLLLDQGLHVIVFDNFSTGKLSNLDLFNPRLEIIQRDISDYHRLVKEMARCDAVLHLAALPSVQKSIEDPLNSLKINLVGFLNMLQALREMHKPLRFVYASSSAVYGKTDRLPCSDEHPLEGQVLSPYALEKVNNERYAELYEYLYGIKSLGLRFFNVYGKRQDPRSPYSGVIAQFISKYQNRKSLTIFGDGEQSRDFIHVSDIARASVISLQSDYCGVLNIATGKAESLNNLVKYIEKAGKVAAKIEHTEAKKGDIKDSYAKVDKAAQYLNFKAEMPLEKGIEQLLASDL